MRPALTTAAILGQALGIKRTVVADRRRLQRQPARVAALREAVQEALEVEATLAREEVATLAAPPQAPVEILDVNVLDRASAQSHSAEMLSSSSP